MRRILGATLLILALSALLFQAVTVPALVTASAQATEFEAQLDPTAQATFGLTYPLTYDFQVPPGSSGLQAQYRYQATDPWVTLPTYASTDHFNGVPAARFDLTANVAYLSVPFISTSNTIFLRVINAQGSEVSLTYQGLPLYYDNRHAAVTVTLDDMQDYYLSSFQATIPLLVSKGLDHTIGVETGLMGATSWAQLQTWLNQGLTEAASHTRTHPCTDQDYQNGGGYTSQISGSRDDLLANLAIPAQVVTAFLEPCGFESTSVRQAVVAAHYLADRSANSGITTFAPWSSDGAYAAIGPTYITDPWPNGGGSATLLAQANAAFDSAYASGGIYHLMDHPWKNLWWAGSYMDQHAQYIAGRTDVWYTAFGNLYQYHYLQERGQVSVTPWTNATPTATLIPNASGTPTPTQTPTVVTTSTYQNAVLGNGALAYWRLGETSGTVAADETGKYPGTYINNPLLGQPGALTGDSNGAVSFNGTNQYVSVPYNAALNPTTFSVEVWAKPTGGSGAYRGVLASRSYPKGWVLYAAGNNTWQLWVNNGTSMLQLSGSAVTLNAWTYLVGTFDGTTARLYVNGVQVSSGTVTTYQPQSSNTMAIGQGEPGSGFYFPGLIDEAAIYGKALSANQIQNDYLIGTQGPAVTLTPTVSLTSTRTISPTPTAGGLAAPTVTLDAACIGAGFTGDAVTVSWANSSPAVSYVDYSTDPNFGSYWNKAVGGTTSTQLSVGFSSGAAVNPNTTYYVRLYNGQHSLTTSFSVPNCSGGLAAPTVTLDVGSVGAGFTGDAVTVSWANSSPPVSFVDFSTDPNFGSYWNKAVGGSTSTKLPVGFSNGAAVNPGTTYYVRLYNGQHSPATSFSLPAATPTPSSGGPAAPTITFDIPSVGTGFTGDAVTVSWVNGTYPVGYVDFSADPNFGSYWNKWVGGTTSTQLPIGFSSGAAVNGGTTYYVRTWDGHNHRPVTSFSIPTATPNGSPAKRQSR